MELTIGLFRTFLHWNLPKCTTFLQKHLKLFFAMETLSVLSGKTISHFYHCAKWREFSVFKRELSTRASTSSFSSGFPLFQIIQFDQFDSFDSYWLVWLILTRFDCFWLLLPRFASVWLGLTHFVSFWLNLIRLTRFDSFDSIWLIWPDLTQFNPKYVLIQFDSRLKLWLVIFDQIILILALCRLKISILFSF